MTDMLKARVTAAIGDEFSIEDELGRGGMSVVYRATDRRLKRKVAIKVLPPEFAYDSGISERFRREAQMAAQLNHPHIIPIYSVDERDGVVYFVMAVCDGESLAARLARTKRSPLADVRRILAEVAGALAYAHSKGVVHRDIKPDNILIEGDSGRALVTDFGIARAAESGARLTVTGIAMGTPAYMSPEQAMGDHELDGRSDVYSLGALAYQMICGVPPFTASNAPSLLMKHVTQDIVPIAERRKEVPPRLAEIVEKALRKKRESRWQSASDMHYALLDEDVLDVGVVVAGNRVQGTGARGQAEEENTLRSGASRESTRGRRTPSTPTSVRASASSATPPLRVSAHSASPSKNPALPQSDVPQWVARGGAEWLAAWRAEQMGLVSEQIRGLRRMFPVSTLLSIATTFFGLLILLEPRDAPILPWFALLILTVASVQGMLRRKNWLEKRGIKFFTALRAKKVVTYKLDEAVQFDGSGLPMSAETFAGPFGAMVVRAMQDGEDVEAALKKLPAVDRKLLPEVLPTVRALVQRVMTLAPALHELDNDIQREDVGALEERIAKIQADIARGAGDKSTLTRTLDLLQKQRATVMDLMERRELMAAQVESAALLLQNIRLDLRKVGSAGVNASVSDVNTATQEARALSKEIGNVLSAADDLRRI